MPRLSPLVALALLSGAACTQAPAQIELKGAASFTRDGSGYTGPIAAQAGPRSYTTTAAPIAPVQPGTGTVANASVGSIGVTELASPLPRRETSPERLQAAAPFRASQASRLSPAAGPAGKPAAANPWTGKPREVILKTEDDQSFNLRPQTAVPSKEQLVSEVKDRPAPPSQGRAISRLDSIIGNEGDDAGARAKARPTAKTGGNSGFMWPVNSRKVVSAFGPKGKGKANDGVNIASANGEPVWAAADGEVVYVGNELGGYGNMVLIKHSGDHSTTYAHLSRATVDKYDRVKQGDIIGYVGSSGSVKDPQLHFAVRQGRDAVDPVKFMKRHVASLH